MKTTRNHRLDNPGSQRAGPMMLAVFILLAVAIAVIGSLPTSAQEDSRAVGDVRVESHQGGELEVSWDAPTDTPLEYRVNWARVGENFPTWTDSSGNAFPTISSYTITGLDQGVRYKVKVRARYDGPPGAWSDIVEAVVASAAPSSTATDTTTPIPADTAASTSTATSTATPIPVDTATSTSTATDTATPIPVDTATSTSTATDTVTPIIADTATSTAQEDSRAVGDVRVESSQSGELEVSWDAPTDTPREYRVNWARVGENFPTWTDSSGNAFPTISSYTITGLDQGVRYKVKVRARYDGPPGAWSDIVEAVVASAAPSSTATNTTTPIPADTPTSTSTATSTVTPIPANTATSTSTLAAPALTAEAADGKVELSWGAVQGATRYELWVWTNDDDWQQIGGENLTDTTYSHDGLTAGTTYHYTIRAVNAAGETGPWSEYVSATLQQEQLPQEPQDTATLTATSTATPRIQEQVVPTATSTSTLVILESLVVLDEETTPTVTATATPRIQVQFLPTVTPTATPRIQIQFLPKFTATATATVGFARQVVTTTVTAAVTPAVTVSYGQSTYSVSEGSAVMVTVTLSADPKRTVIIPITSTNQGGASNDDYSGVPASVTFNSGDTEKSFSVTATDDSLDDDDESVKLAFGTLPTGVTAGTTNETTVSITDNDDPVVKVSYAQSSYSVGEGSTVAITVTLSADPKRTVTVPITSTNQGGASSDDYSGVPDSLTFNSGDTEKTFDFAAAQDADIDVSESVKLGFGTLPTGVSAGTHNETTVNIMSPCVAGGAVPAGEEYAGLARDCEILLGLHDDLVGTATLSPAWSVDNRISSWEGIILVEDRVDLINLGAQNLDGSIPAALGTLSKLTNLDLRNNMLTGTIPSELGDLSELIHLILPFNMLTGAIPSELGSLTNLKELNVSNNQLTGSIPETLGDLSALESLLLNSNPFDAEIPTELTQLTSLKTLEMVQAQLKGPILDLSVMTSLERVVMHDNQLTGTISSLANLTGLKRLHLGTNRLSGTVPNIADLPMIDYFNVEENQFTGAVPDITAWPLIRFFNVNRNQLTGSIPPLSNLPELEDYYVHRNMLSGPIPIASSLPKLKNFWAHCNRFSGSIPTALNSITTLDRVLLFDNQLTGEIPDLSGPGSMTWLWLSHNHLEGDFTDINAIAAKLPSSITWLSLNGNLFEGVDRDTGVIAATLPDGVSWPNLARAPCNPRASFDATTYSATEGSVITVTVQLEVAAGDSVAIPLVVGHNGGASATDYSNLPSSLTFGSDETLKSFTFTVTDDDENDDDESLTLSFGTLPTGVNPGSPMTTTINLVDNDLATVSFSAASYTAIEGGSAVTITVELSDELEESVTIPITTTNQGGASNDDYSGVPNSLTFSSGDTEKSFAFSATQDTDNDDGESVKLAFGTLPTGVSEGTISEATVSITDDDLPAVTVSYQQSSYTVGEGSSVAITVTLSAAPERTVTIPIARTNQGGASNADYTGVPASVTFSSGDTEKSFTFSATQDTDDDDGESVKLGFGTLPTGVSTGTYSETTVNITETCQFELPATEWMWWVHGTSWTHMTYWHNGAWKTESGKTDGWYLTDSGIVWYLTDSGLGWYFESDASASNRIAKVPVGTTKIKLRRFDPGVEVYSGRDLPYDPRYSDWDYLDVSEICEAGSGNLTYGPLTELSHLVACMDANDNPRIECYDEDDVGWPYLWRYGENWYD